MSHFLRVGGVVLVVALLLSFGPARAGSEQLPPLPERTRDGDLRLPNGKSQREEILKAEYEQNLKDAGRLVEMAEELKQDMEKNDRFVLSIATLKKTDDIEKLIKKIRSRMRH